MRTTLLLTLLLTSSALTFATGPSFLREKMKPISINDKGEILCRTKYEINMMGSQRIVDIEYGLCVVTPDTIVQKHIFTLKSDPYIELEEYLRDRNHWDSLYNSPLSESEYCTVEASLRTEYGFKYANVAAYEVNDTLTVKKLREERRVDLVATPMKALNGGRSVITSEDDSLRVFLSYDFGHVLFLENDYEDPDKDDFYDVWAYAQFDYQNPTAQLVEYEMPYITGIVFRDKKQRKVNLPL